MQIKRIFLVSAIFLCSLSSVFAAKGILATDDDIKKLKSDLLAEKVQVNVTRAKNILKKYGDPTTFEDTEKKLSFYYAGLIVDFTKERYFRKWEYDTFKEKAYSKDIEKLIFDLGRGEIVGDYVSLSTFKKNYGPPTKIYETKDDGDISIYYWGDVKCYFENFYIVETWEGAKLERKAPVEVLEVK